MGPKKGSTKKVEAEQAHSKTARLVAALMSDPTTSKPVRDALFEVICELQNDSGVDLYSDEQLVRRSLELTLPAAEAKGLRYSDGGLHRGSGGVARGPAAAE